MKGWQRPSKPFQQISIEFYIQYLFKGFILTNYVINIFSQAHNSTTDKLGC